MQKSVPVPLQQRLQDMRLRMIPAMDGEHDNAVLAHNPRKFLQPSHV